MRAQIMSYTWGATMAICCYGSLPKSQIGLPYILGSVVPKDGLDRLDGLDGLDGLDRLDGLEPISKMR